MEIPRDSNILVVEDSQNMRKAVINILHNMGFTNISEATDGMNALEIIKVSAEQELFFDFIIADHNMPNFTGLDLLKHIRQLKQYKITPFILITTHSDSDLVFQFIDAKVSQFIVKPIDPYDFQTRLFTAWNKWKEQKLKSSIDDLDAE